MKVAIVTLIDYYNQGNRLQNYALQEKIKELGHEVDTLGVFALRGLYGAVEFSMHIFFTPLYKRMKKNKILSNQTQKLIAVDNYSKKKLNELGKKYDAVVIGSDQVWNPQYLDYPYVLFGFFADKEKCMSYAGSFGVSKIAKNRFKQYKKGLGHIPYISVRENEGSALVKEIVGENAPVVLDPTLLLTKEEWMKYAKPYPNKPKKYLLTYSLMPKKKVNRYIKKLQKETGLEVVNLNRGRDKHFIHTSAEFIDLFLNAEVIVTNSFHGHAMSIALEKPFISFISKKSTSSRVYSLLKNLGLENRTSDKIKKEEYFTLDYTDVNKKLAKKREESLAFLKKSLESIEKSKTE